MSLLSGLKCVVAVIGHFAIWCAFYNQLHANSWPSPGRKAFDKIIYLFVPVLGVILAWHILASEKTQSLPSVFVPAFDIYTIACIAAAALVTTRWVWWKATERSPSRLLRHRVHESEVFQWDGPAPLHGIQARLLSYVPGNQILQPRVEIREIAVRGLPPASDGFCVVQLSDLHFTGKIGLEYFRRVSELCSRQQPDLVVITGDIVDEARCLPWLDATLGSLRGKIGQYYVLGNHDRRIHDERRLRDSIERTGFQPLGGRWVDLPIPGGSLWLCGNEFPWYRGAETIPNNPPSELSAPRILAAHSPDQIRWAQQHKIDLMLAGHCHGGQIRLPLIGPIISPSRHGVRFASGVFEQGDLTVHVSRGISAEDPIRWNCPPEVSVIKLRSELRTASDD